MVLAAADSTLEGMLSLNVNVIEEGAGASSSQYCALVMVGGAGMVHHDDMGRCVKSQALVIERTGKLQLAKCALGI